MNQNNSNQAGGAPTAAPLASGHAGTVPGPTQAQKAIMGEELAEKLAKEAAEKEEQRINAERIAKEEAEKKKVKITLFNTKGQKVSNLDYFYSTKGEDTAPSYFHKVCGKPVDREDMLNVFDKVFKPEHNVLFYRAPDKEVYMIIVPLKYSSVIGIERDSVDGEYQKHAISFITEGSVNLDSLKTKLLKVASTIKFAD